MLVYKLQKTGEFKRVIDSVLYFANTGCLDFGDYIVPLQRK